MTRTQYYTAASLDGFIADEDNSLQWLFDVEGTEDDTFATFIADVGAVVMGATTYEWLLEHERVLDDPAKWRQWHGDRPTVVFSSRDLPSVPGVELARGDVRPVHERLVDEAAGRNVWLVGGGDLVGQFADAGLLDDIFVAMAPVTLGAGAPLLPRRITSGLRLHDVRRVQGAFALLHLTVERS